MKTAPPSTQYRNWLRMGIRMFDTPDSVLSPGDRVSWMHLEDLEVAAELCGLDLRQVKAVMGRIEA